jgi:trimeric autotransporter adhesin
MSVGIGLYLVTTTFGFLACGVGGSASGTVPTGPTTPPPNPLPSLNSIVPASAPVGSSAITIAVGGAGFVSSSVIQWNGSSLTTTYVTSTALAAQVSSTDLQTAGTTTVTVTTPSPGGGTSGPLSFPIGPGVPGVTALNALANDLAWDPVNQVIYLSIPSIAATNGNAVQIVNPVKGTLGATTFVGSEPDLLSVSETSKYLYVSQDGASSVQVMTLPGLSNDLTIQLGGDASFGSFYAMDLQAAPNSDDSVAVVRGEPEIPEEIGGVVIYNNGTELPDVVCGYAQTGCPNPDYRLDSIQWNSTGTEMYAANNEDTGFDFYRVRVNSSGFGTVTDYPGLLPDFYTHIHYDATTGYVYDDDGDVVNPSDGTLVGTFAASGLMVPDGALGVAFFLGKVPEAGILTMESFDINTFAPIASLNIPNVLGVPTNLIRWGSNGLAFSTSFFTGNEEAPLAGNVVLISGSFVSGGAAKRGPVPSENVRRTWRRGDVLHGATGQKTLYGR